MSGWVSESERGRESREWWRESAARRPPLAVAALSGSPLGRGRPVFLASRAAMAARLGAPLPAAALLPHAHFNFVK